MANYDEIFAAMPATAAEEAHNWLVIDADAQTIDVPDGEELLGVENDGKARRKYFQVPRFVGDGVDLAACFIRINYRNANGDKDSYLVEDLAVNGDLVTFSWELYSRVTAYKGQVQFLVCACFAGADGTSTVKWHTTLATGTVLEGMEPDAEAAEEATADVIAQLLALVAAQTAAVEAAGAAQIEAVQAEGSTQVQTVQTAASAAKQAAVDEVVAKGVNTLATIPDDYTALYNDVQAMKRSKAPAIVCEAEGQTIQVTDASGDHLHGLRIFGKTTQQTTTGAQLFNAYGEQYTEHGTAEISDGGRTITVTGQAYVEIPINLTAGASYYLDFAIKSSTAFAGINFKYTDGTTIAAESGKGVFSKPAAFVPTKNVGKIVLNCALDHTTGGTSVYEGIMITEGETTQPWEPYTGGMAAPCPEYPQALENMPAPVVTVCGKNLLQNNFAAGYTETVRGVTFTVNADKSIHVAGTPTAAIAYNIMEKGVFPAGTYFLYGAPSTASQKFRLQVNKTVDGVEKTVGVEMGVGARFTVETDGTPLRGYIYVAADAGAVDGVFYPQLERSSAATEYEPYTSQTVTLAADLPGIPVASGGNYTDANGQQWICDEVDLARGVYVQRIGTATFDGGGDGNDGKEIAISTTVTQVPPTNVRFDFFDANIKNVMAQPTNAQQNIVCNYGTPAVKANYNGVWLNDNPWFYGRISMPGAVASTVAELKALLQVTPIVFAFPLAEPVETQLTEAELAAWAALHSNKPTTTLLNNAGAHMIAEYSADPKLYIDRKLAELVAANYT